MITPHAMILKPGVARVPLTATRQNCLYSDLFFCRCGQHKRFVMQRKPLKARKRFNCRAIRFSAPCVPSVMPEIFPHFPNLHVTLRARLNTQKKGVLAR
jgi:hypothetical protein